jgi:hypothetical protein
MPYTFAVERDGHAIRVVPDGTDDLPTTLGLIRELRARLVDFPDARVLVDVRPADYLPTAADAQRIAAALAAPPGPEWQRIALLTGTVVGFGIARMVSLRAENAGGRPLLVFQDLERAERWLAGGPEEEEPGEPPA